MKSSASANGRAYAGPPRSRSRRWLRWIFIATGVLAAGAFVSFLDRRGSLREVLGAVARLGSWGPVFFILSYALAAVFFFPGAVLTLGAGALFGLVRGCIYVSIGSTLGAACAFLVGRHFARAWVQRKVEGNAAFAAIDRAVEQDGWKIVILTRLSPVFPYSLLNYAFGLSRVSFPGYVLASWLGMMPWTALYVYVGSAAHSITGESRRTPVQWALYGVGLAATLGVTILVTRKARAALARRRATDAPL